MPKGERSDEKNKLNNEHAYGPDHHKAIVEAVKNFGAR